MADHPLQKKSVPIVLFEATEKVDAGQIYLRDEMKFSGTELVQDLRKIQGFTTINLCKRFIKEYPNLLSSGIEQSE